MSEETKRIPIRDLISEEGAHELATSPDMQPYIRPAMAAMQGADPKPQLEEIAQLPLEKRYGWRVASALKRGFADFDDICVDADRDTLRLGPAVSAVQWDEPFRQAARVQPPDREDQHTALRTGCPSPAHRPTPW